VEFSVLVNTLGDLEKTTKRLELTDILASLLEVTPPETIDKVVYLIQGKLYPDFMGVEIGLAERLVMKGLSIATGANMEQLEKRVAELGDLGSVAEEFLEKRTQITLLREPLTVERVYENLDRAAKVTGSGAQEAKLRLLTSLLNNATPKEAKFLVRMVVGKLRLGIADYTILDALSTAFTGSKDARKILERAYNLCSDLGAVARVLAVEGLKGIENFGITVGRPVRPMLAERLPTAQEALEKIGTELVAEYKLDGERVQVHKRGDEIFLFSRRLENITHHYPDVVELAKSNLRVSEGIFESEVVGIDPNTGEMLPFQELMQRRRKYDVEKMMQKIPVSIHFFDVLCVDGEDLTVKPYIERRRILDGRVIRSERVFLVPSIITKDSEEIEKFMERAVSEGCEGLVVKDPSSVYRAGAREFSWIKLKREYRGELTDTVDLVIVGAFYGRGKRAGRYGAYLLATYNDEEDVFESVCKVGSGFTDEDLEAFTKMTEPLIIPQRHARVSSRMEANVWFIPKVVIEVLASEITLSPLHSCALDKIRKDVGIALRFPRYTGRLRRDKSPEQATTTKELLGMYARQIKKKV